MTVLIPEARVDKRGISVVRYVREGSAGTAGTALSAPPMLPMHSRSLNSFSGAETPATARMDERIEGKGIPTGVLDHADYADVSAEGISYGLHLGESLLRDILVGAQNQDEDWSDHDSRFREALADFDPSVLNDYFSENYGADLVHEDASLTLEFFLAYGDGGAGASSLEDMSRRAAKETDLLEARSDYLESNTLLSGAAQALGYVWQKNSVGGRYVKDDAVLHTANYRQHELLEEFMSDLYDRAIRIGSYKESKLSADAALYNSAANTVSAIGSRRRKHAIGVDEQLRREAMSHRAAASLEPDESLRSAHAHLEEMFLDMARQAEDAA